jgi:hypothetical protein
MDDVTVLDDSLRLAIGTYRDLANL